MAGALVESTSIMSEGARLIAGKHFDLALIELLLPDMAGIELAALAANQKTDVLLLSGNSSSTEHARRLGYSCLEQPVEGNLLVAESIAVMQRAHLLVGDLAASVDKMDIVMKSLTAEVAEANRVFDRIVSRLRRKKD
jgi:DNA-binding response OmpR family regulator